MNISDRIMCAIASWVVAQHTLVVALEAEHIALNLFYAFAAAFWVWFGFKAIRDGVE